MNPSITEQKESGHAKTRARDRSPLRIYNPRSKKAKEKAIVLTPKKNHRSRIMRFSFFSPRHVFDRFVIVTFVDGSARALIIIFYPPFISCSLRLLFFSPPFNRRIHETVGARRSSEATTFKAHTHIIVYYFPSASRYENLPRG